MRCVIVTGRQVEESIQVRWLYSREDAMEGIE